MIFIFLIGKNHGFSKIITDDPKFAWSNPMSSGLWGIIHDHVHRFFLVKHYIYSPNAKPPQFSSSILLRSSVFHISSHGFSMFSHGFPMVFPLGPSPSAKACGLDGAPPSHSEPQQLTRRATGVYGGSPEPGASWPVRRWLVKGSLW